MARLAFVGSSALAAASGGGSTSAPRRTRTPMCTANSPYAPDPTAAKPTLNPYLAKRAAERARAIAADSQAKAVAWEAELQQLRSKSNGIVHAPTLQPSYAQRLSSIYNKPATYSSRAAVQAFVDGKLYENDISISSTPAPTEPESDNKVESIISPSVSTPSKASEVDSTIESKVSSSVSTLYKAPDVLTSPESTDSSVSQVQNSTDVPAPTPTSPVSELTPPPEPIPEAVLASSPAEPTLKKETRPAPKKAPELVSEPEPTAKAPTNSNNGLKGFSAGIIDAIVDGVEGTLRTKKSSSPPKSKSEPDSQSKPIPANVLDAVNEGKLSSLTVTKLRRMLSECGLKTGGRKSELIARLTSFVRK